MALTIVDHPLARHLLMLLRDRETLPALFRPLTKRLGLPLVLEALRDLPEADVEVETPMERASGRRLGTELVAVPILRAGLGLLEAVTELMPDIAVGYVGLERDEDTLEPQTYYEKLPPVEDRVVLMLDPMLATGGTASAACTDVKRGAPAQIRFVCVVAAPEGAARMEADHPDVPIFAAALDQRLDDRGYILPGLGDFGDRLFGTP